MFSGWESLNNDFSLVKQLQCGLNHITGSQKPFWPVNSTNSKVSVGGSGLDGGDGRGSRGLRGRWPGCQRELIRMGLSKVMEIKYFD